jgi:prefoldin subunit 4
MMVDESQPGSTKLMVGESFFDVDSGTATEYIGRELDKAKEGKAAVEGELGRIDARQAELKKILYARFGSSINLEESP